MRIAITGGTGTLGAYVADELRARDHEVRVLSRKSAEHPVDLTTGSGLAEALDGCEVVVDASNNASPKGAKATLVDGSRRLLSAERPAGVGHHVCISIVGCDRAPLGYYKTKTEQERIVAGGPVPWSIVRATQFHELVGIMFARCARWRVLPAPRVKLQTVAALEVAAVVADVATGAPLQGRVEVAGPEVRQVRDLAASWRSIKARPAVLLPLPFPGPLGRALRDGALTNDAPDVRGSTIFEAWLRGGE